MISTPEPKNFYNNLQLKFIRTAQWTSFKLYHKAGGLKIVVIFLGLCGQQSKDEALDNRLEGSWNPAVSRGAVIQQELNKLYNVK